MGGEGLWEDEEKCLWRQDSVCPPPLLEWRLSHPEYFISFQSEEFSKTEIFWLQYPPLARSCELEPRANHGVELGLEGYCRIWEKFGVEGP